MTTNGNSGSSSATPMVAKQQIIGVNKSGQAVMVDPVIFKASNNDKAWYRTVVQIANMLGVSLDEADYLLNEAVEAYRPEKPLVRIRQSTLNRMIYMGGIQ